MELPDLSLLLVMVVFWATFFVLRAFLLKPLGAILEERERRAEEAAAVLGKALDREKETLAEVDRRLTEARREAIAIREKLRAELNVSRQAALDRAREESRKTVASAQARLELEVAAAREELRAGARAMAAEIASNALGRRVA